MRVIGASRADDRARGADNAQTHADAAAAVGISPGRWRAGRAGRAAGTVPAGSADAEIDQLSQEKARLEEQELAEASAQRQFPAECLAP